MLMVHKMLTCKPTVAKQRLTLKQVLNLELTQKVTQDIQVGLKQFVNTQYTSTAKDTIQAVLVSSLSKLHSQGNIQTFKINPIPVVSGASATFKVSIVPYQTTISYIDLDIKLEF